MFDDVRIYSRRLDACAVSDLAASYAGTPASPPPAPPPVCAGFAALCTAGFQCCSGVCAAGLNRCFF